MSSQKPSFFFIPGAFHGPEAFKPLVLVLKDAGYTCVDDFCLPGVGNESTASLQQDVDAVRDAVLKILEGGRNCVVVMHSMGSIPAIQGLKGLGKKDRGDKPGVLKLVYLSTSMPAEGQTHLDQLTTFLSENGYPAPDWMTVKDNVVTFIGAPDLFYNDLPEEEKKKYYGELKTQSLLPAVTPLTYTAYKDIPGWYLKTLQDQILLPDYQTYVMKNGLDNLEVVEEIDAGHFAFLSRPDKVGDFIIRAAQSAEKDA